MNKRIVLEVVDDKVVDMHAEGAWEDACEQADVLLGALVSIFKMFKKEGLPTYDVPSVVAQVLTEELKEDNHE